MKMSDLDLDRQIIEAMKDPDDTAEIQIERKCDAIIRDLDEICRLATNSETIDLIERERVAIGQIVVRAQLAAALLMAKQPGKLRLVHA